MRANVPSYEKDMHYVESRHMNKKEQALTKFAQSIIKECTEVALREDHNLEWKNE
jgi:hypothetical protein